MIRRLVFIFLAFLFITIGLTSILLVRYGVAIPLFSQETTFKPLALPSAKTRLAILPNPFYLVAPRISSSAELDIVMNTGGNDVETVQFELGYNPSVIRNISITPKGEFTNATVVLHINDLKNGRLSYAMKRMDGKNDIQGAIASLTFIPVSTASTKILFLPKTSVSATDVVGSALLEATGTTVFFSPQLSPKVSPKIP
jgi:hypothetical protein